MSLETFLKKLPSTVGGIFLSGGTLAWTSNFVRVLADDAGTGSWGPPVAHYHRGRAFTVKLPISTSFAKFSGALWAFFAQPNEFSRASCTGKIPFPVPIKCEVAIASWAYWKKEPHWAVVEFQSLLQTVANETWPMAIFIDISQIEHIPAPDEISDFIGQFGVTCPVYVVNSVDSLQVREVFQNLINWLTN